MQNSQFPSEVSLCLSGGAARGAFHLGVISVLEENNVQIKAISGSSVGALIGGSLACGKSSKEIFDILKSKAFKKVFKLSLGKGYVFKVDMDAEVISSLVDKNSFSELDIFLDIAVTNVTEAKVQYYNSGDNLKKIIRASCSISPLIQSVHLEGELLTDGGMTDNFPIQRLKHLAYKTIGINLYPNNPNEPKSIIAWVKKMIYLAWYSHNIQKIGLCDIYVTHWTLNKLSTFTFRDLDKAYALGRSEMKKIYAEYTKS